MRRHSPSPSRRRPQGLPAGLAFDDRNHDGAWQREQYACAQLGLTPGGAGFTHCVARLGCRSAATSHEPFRNRTHRMLAIVRLALKRPYTFIVLAILIVLFGGLAAIRTPTDIFPDIRIPVIAAVWTYRGLSPDDMAGRVVYYYERQLSTSVNDIDHIESQSLSGVGIVKIFFHPGVDIRTATACRLPLCHRRCSSRCRRALLRR